LAPLNRLMPVHRLARLYWNRKALFNAAMIVSTERTCLTLKRHWRRRAGPKFAYIPHGSGDRNVAVHPALKDFDLCLVSGQKVVDQLVEAEVTTAAKCRVIGYAKFDILRGREPEKFFDNDRPTFLYNPHFDPFMSSWFDHGPAILQYFYDRPDQYNLIFAPHVMLFVKAVHISLEYKITRRRPNVDPKFKAAPNIRIDTESERLFDMSYTLSADAYIGDVSSQIYEFLIRPRPCFFVDVHSGGSGGVSVATESSETPAYDFWRNGPVVTSAQALAEILPDFAAIGERFRDIQVDRMAYTADTSDPRPASERGAAAIMDVLGITDAQK
jgi:CDP-glycerol glycerophosphotransferase (TagB/SpsB family)